jgi:LysM repeat protein
MNHDEKTERPPRRRQAYDPDSKPAVASESDESGRVPRTPFRPITGPLPGPSVSSSPWVPATTPRRGPSHPAWEKPPTPYIFPELRGRERRRSMPAMWPLIVAAIGVAVVLGALVVVPALTGHGGNAAVASRSATPATTSQASGSGAPANSAGPSASQANAGSPTPFVSYQQYKVQTGDRLLTIAKKFNLQTWEILVANPQITNPNLLKVGSFLNIPQPGQLTQPPASPSATPAAT